MEMDRRRKAKEPKPLDAGRVDQETRAAGKPKISRGGEGDLGTIMVTDDDLEAVKKGLEKAARLPPLRLQQRMG